LNKFLARARSYLYCKNRQFRRDFLLLSAPVHTVIARNKKVIARNKKRCCSSYQFRIDNRKVTACAVG
jgi:hypothetical protein